jgi:4-deoxy-L-threo-5-hexosulose-uronate ketol-isomerase
MRLLSALSAADTCCLAPDALRHAALVEGVFASGEVRLAHWETDRTILGGAVPLDEALVLPVPCQLAATHFCERRELGVINLGGPGVVEVDGAVHALGRLDGLYVGRGARRVAFSSDRPSDPARYYLLSYPAHAALPTTLIPFSGIPAVELGDPASANARVIHKYIHPDGVRSCQLVMGVTRLRPGSVWNTMPPHTHLRRSEVYLYFDLGPDQVVFHFLGRPQETRHLVVRDGQAALSPPWSIHCGVGSAHYSFVWGMGGENQTFADMDPAPLRELR